MVDVKEQLAQVQWERACIVAGLWERGRVCHGCSERTTTTALSTKPVHVLHEVPCPPFLNSATTMAMINWLAPPPFGELILQRRHGNWLIQRLGSEAVEAEGLAEGVVRAVLRVQCFLDGVHSTNPAVRMPTK